MADFPEQLRQFEQADVICSVGMGTWFGAAARLSSTGTLSQGYSSANLAMLIPFGIDSFSSIVGFSVMNGSSVSGNFDVGIYDAITLSKIVSTGSTAQSGTSTIQVVSVSATTLQPGHYYLAIACDNTTANFTAVSTDSNILKSLGVFQMASAFPLPSTITLADPATISRVPVFSAHRSVVA